MNTTLHTWKTGILGHPFHRIAKVAEAIERLSYYPRFHDGGNEGFRVRHSVMVDDGVVQIVSDDNTTEWIWFKEDGTAIYTKSGWGSEGYALYDALKHAYGAQ